MQPFAGFLTAVWRKTMGLFSKLFDPNAGEIKRLSKIVDKIDSFEEAHKKLTDAQLREKTGACAFHLSAKKTVESGMVFRREGVPMGLPMMSEFERFVTDCAAVTKAKKALEYSVRK